MLVAAWGLVLGPAVLQSVGAGSPVHTEKMFRRSMRTLGSRRPRSAVGARSILVPPKPDYPVGSMAAEAARARAQHAPTAAERRRRNLTYLAMFIIATFFLGLVPGLRFLLIVNLVADLLLILYLVLALYLSVWPPPSERGLPPIDRQTDLRRRAV